MHVPSNPLLHLSYISQAIKGFKARAQAWASGFLVSEAQPKPTLGLRPGPGWAGLKRAGLGQALGFGPGPAHH